jgi:DNA-binding NarL/FixJ family response regulator
MPGDWHFFARMGAAVITPRAAVSVAVAEDHPVVREGLTGLLAGEGGFAVAGSAGSARELRLLLERQPPQVLVMDLMLHEEDGLALIKDLAALLPVLRIVVFSLQPEDIYAERCLRAGAHGYVMKLEPVATLFAAVRTVVTGGIAVSPAVSHRLLGNLGSGAPQPTGPAALTDRELQVFRLTGLALPTRAVAGKLGISVKTVEAHRENIKNKLGLDTHAALVARAAQWVQEAERAGRAASS